MLEWLLVTALEAGGYYVHVQYSTLEDCISGMEALHYFLPGPDYQCIRSNSL